MNRSSGDPQSANSSEPARVEDIPPQVLEDETPWALEVFERYIKPHNPGLAAAIEAALKRLTELARSRE